VSAQARHLHAARLIFQSQNTKTIAFFAVFNLRSRYNPGKNYIIPGFISSKSAIF
jgi:hypothetical protein